jgi:ABC-type dipeptide/oligopeptide/nickel transport system permease component
MDPGYSSIGGLPEVSPWDISYTWLHFWMDGRMEPAFLEMGRFVFYMTHMYGGEFGVSWVIWKPVSSALFEYGMCSILIIVIALLIAFWIFLVLKMWKSNFQVVRNEKNREKTRILIGLSLMISAVTGIPLVYFVSITCPLLFRNLIFWWLRYQYYHWENFNLYDPQYFAIPAFILAGMILIGWKLSLKVQAHPSSLLSFKETNPPEKIRQVIIQRGLRAAFFCSFVLASIIFIEAVFPFYGIGRLFRISLLSEDFPVMNAILFLGGIIVIVVSFSVEVIYGLLQFGPYRFHRTWILKLRKNTIARVGE